MDFAFPEFVRASNDTAPPTPPQKSLWQLVMESGPNDIIPERVVPRRAATNYAEDYGGERGAHYGMRDVDGDAAAAGATGWTASTSHAAAGLTSRTSWTPAPYMIQHLMFSGFVSQFAMLHGVECSARLPPPPCLRLQDLQLPPLVLSRLRRQLFSPRETKPLNSDVLPETSQPDLRELQEIVFGSHPMPARGGGTDGSDRVEGGRDGRRDTGGDEDDLREELGTMSALQQLAVTSMLLGHHTLSVGPRGTGKKTAGLLATGALTLARGIHKKEEEEESKKNGESTGDGGAGGETVVGLKHESPDECTTRPAAPQAMILVSSFHEVKRCNRWLQDVFTAGAFMPMTFLRGTTDLAPLPVFYERPCFQGGGVPQEWGARAPPSLPHPQFPPPPPPATAAAAAEVLSSHAPLAAAETLLQMPPPGEEAHHRHHSSREERPEERSLHRRGREHSRGRHHHHRHSHSPAAKARAGSRRRRRHRSSSRRHSRERRHHRSGSRDRRHDKRRRGSRRQHRRRSSDASSRHDKKRRRRERSRSRHSHRHDDRHGEDRRQEASHPESPVEQWTRSSLGCPDVTAAPSPAAANDASTAVDSRDEIPQFLRRRVPILIATHQSLVEALQMVQGQAEVLPLECVRIVCISDADRVAQPTSQIAVPASWWISLSNAVDVECQYIVSASRMYDEVDGWLQETLLHETPDVVNRYRQRDDTVWDGVQHILEEVTVEEAEGHAAQPMFERVEAAKMRRLLRIIAQQFRSSHAGAGEDSGVAGTHHRTHGSAMPTPATPFTSAAGRMVVVVSSRKEQDSVFPQLLAGLRESGARVRCTCQLTDFQRGEADVLVTYDWVMCVASDSDDVTSGPVDVVVNFGFPRALMAPGKEESLLECLVIRTRTLLHHTASSDTVKGEEEDDGDDRAAFFERRDAPSAGMQRVVVTFLTERQLHGRFGRLLATRAQAMSPM